MPVLGDPAYGDNTELRERLHDGQLEYVLSVSAEMIVFAPGTAFVVPERKGATGRPRGRLRPQSKPVAIGEFIADLHPNEWQTVTFRDGPDGEPMTSRFSFARVRAAHLWNTGYTQEPREEWLICEWPEGQEKPTDYWLSNLSADTEPERLARLARMHWKIELDYKQLKGELGLDHYEGAHTSAGTTTPRWLRPRTGSSPWSESTLFASGRPDAAPSSTDTATRVQVTGPAAAKPVSNPSNSNDSHYTATDKQNKPNKAVLGGW